MDRNTGFAQYGLRNAVELVRIGPSLGMAEFISNSAIQLPSGPGAVLMAAAVNGSGREKMADFTTKSVKVTVIPVGSTQLRNCCAFH